jgi:hypothetical protein
MKELNTEEMTSLRGGQSFDISNSFNGSNNGLVVSAGNTAQSLPINVSGSQGNVRQAAAANAGNQLVSISQG